MMRWNMIFWTKTKNSYLKLIGLIKWLFILILGFICLSQYQRCPIVVCIYATLVVVMNGLSFIAVKKKKKVKKNLLFLRNFQLITACMMAMSLWVNVESLIPEKAVYNSESQITNNMDILINLKPEKWETLSMQDRIDVLQCVVDCEAYDLGLTRRLKVIAKDMAADGVSGRYSDTYHEIKIDKGVLMNSEAEYSLAVVCHEVYHSYEYRLVELYEDADDEMKKLKIFDNVVTYKKEFENYVDSGGDKVAYNMQRCEQDADLYAEMAVKKYYDYIEEYVK